MCREEEPTLNLHFLRNYGPLKIFLQKSCPLYNFNTVQNIFMKLCRNINHHKTMRPLYNFNTSRTLSWNHYQTMCSEEEPMKIVSAI